MLNVYWREDDYQDNSANSTHTSQQIFVKLNRRKYAFETHVLVYQDDMAMEVHLIFWILDSPYLLFLNFVYT